MEIRINGKVAALKTGSSFDYIIENRSFTGSDGYSMTISFPLRGCPQNTPSNSSATCRLPCFLLT